MLVCPQCRSDNAEEAEFCSNCGRSLAPDATSLGRTIRREPRDVDEELEALAPRKTSPVPGIIALAAVAAGLVAGAAWLLLRPSPCEGKFASDRYPYCVALPAGWTDATQEVGGAEVDSFQPRTQGAAVLVVAENLEGSLSTEEYAELYRDAQEEGGLFPGPTEPEVVDGESALAWDIAGTNEEGTRLHQRQLAVVQEGKGWVITLVGSVPVYDDAEQLFDRMIQTWQWK